MQDQETTKEQLINELENLRRRVTELEESEARLIATERLMRESEEKFRLLYENAPLGYQSLDENGFFLEVNQAWLDTLGYSRNEVIGKWCGDFLTAPYQEKFTLYFQQFKETGDIRGIEFEMVKRDRSTIFVTADGKIGRDRQGRFKQTHCILHDVTERKKAEESLDRANREWERTFNSMPDLIMVLDTHHKILRANKSMAVALGITEREVIGKCCYELVHKEKEPPEFCPHSKLLADGESHSVEVIEHRLGGTYKIRVSPVIDDNGQAIGSVHILRDITERKQMEESLRKSENDTALSFEESRDGVYSVLRDGEITNANLSFLKLFGYASEIIGKRFGEIGHCILRTAQDSRKR